MSSLSFSTIQSPFQRLRDLLAGETPGAAPIDMTIGEPRHGFPAFAADIIQSHSPEYGKYPPIAGVATLRNNIAAWLAARAGLREGVLDAERHVLPLSGTREGLVSALVIARAKKDVANPAVLMPNPFYQAYYAAAIACGCEAVMLPATTETGFLPDLDAIEPALLDRTIAFYIASPANPQGSVASLSYLEKLVGLARSHGFYLFSDECYSEIYRAAAPESALSATKNGGDFSRVLVFNSLSKRSNAPGLRSGFVAGDPEFIGEFLRYRNVASPQVPLPIQHASAALWGDEAHVEESRALYRKKFEIARARLGNAAGYYDPDGGFFLWLDASALGGGVEAATTFWKACGVRVLPGAYLAQPDAQGRNPGKDYVRLALVDSPVLTAEALDRLSPLLL